MTTEAFHAGERVLQQRSGMRARMAEVGPRVIRDFMLEQHCNFFEQLSFVIVGALDSTGQPWASLLAAPAGFMQCTDPRHLFVRAQPLPGDPLVANLREGALIGLLGIEPHTRRRNSMNGKVLGVRGAGFVVEVEQSFGNCPKYIQAREPVFVEGKHPTPAVYESTELDARARHMIAGADTLFIATSYAGEDDTDPEGARGVDVSHHGGKPGFVRVDANGTLTIPDFMGNYFFNTLGNIAVQPQAGLLFPDFDNGELLFLAVTAEIIWDGEELASFAGAERLSRCKVSAMKRLERAMPLRWGAAEFSSMLAATGTWD